MAKTNDVVKFYRGRELAYKDLYATNPDSLKGVLFFCTDTLHIIYNNNKYGLGNSDLNGFATEEWVNELYKEAFVKAESAYLNGSLIISFEAKNGEYNESIAITSASSSNPGLMSANDKAKLDEFLAAINYVLKEEGKGLSTNDFTNTLKNKLDSIEENAEVNKITEVRVDGAALDISIEGNTRAVNIDLTDTIKEVVGITVGSVYVYQGTKSQFNELTNEPGIVGHVWNIENEFTLDNKVYPAGTNVAWNGAEWDPLGGTVDLSPIINRLNAAESSINSHASRLDSLESAVGTGSGNLTGRVETLEDKVETLEGPDTEEGSVKYTALNTATAVVTDALNWVELE